MFRPTVCESLRFPVMLGSLSRARTTLEFTEIRIA